MSGPTRRHRGRTARPPSDAYPDDDDLNDRIDDAYRAKYAGSAYLPPMVADGPRAATVEVTPRS
ncbi:DUF2255 family protein [Acidipropionibacterium timonense]|uniref:DUF2255 family protein n=1 Tax=Acidipropionibacterium timonense TaxID=2161818 RepID=UPI001FDA2BE3|nr:DUF2255 family protein [Acidipropionibacterium timonense]